MSARISGVKNFVSIGESLVRAFPFSQVQSANANGSAFFGVAGTCVPMATAASKDGSAATELDFAAATDVDSAELEPFASLAPPARSCTGAALLRPKSARSTEVALFALWFAAIEALVRATFAVTLGSLFATGTASPVSSAFFGAAPFASNSSTRRSNCSTRSSRILSRSLKAAGASTFFSAFALPPESVFAEPAAAFFTAESFAPPSSASARPGALKLKIPANPNTPIHFTFFTNEPITLSLQRCSRTWTANAAHAPAFQHHSPHREHTHASAALPSAAYFVAFIR